MNLNLLQYITPTFITAYIIIALLEIYIFNLPYILTGDSAIVKEYYYQNWKTNLPLDFFFIFIYFIIADMIWTSAGIRKTSERLLVLVGTTIVLTGGWCIWFNTRPATGSFFSRWFRRVGWITVLYDVILLSSVYLVYVSLTNRGY
jgi:hypothetical protein